MNRNVSWLTVFTSLFMVILVWALGLRYMANQPHHLKTACLSNIKQLGTALAAYAAEADDHLPPAAWMTPLHPTARNWGIFSDPLLERPQGMTGKPTVSGYALNYRLIGRTLATVDPQCITFFETDALGPDVVTNLAARSGRHGGGSNVGRADGLAKKVKLGEQLREVP